jgi:hypothetical protein
MDDLRESCVSVVIPTRNRPAMLVAAVESVLAQTEGLLEVIVVVDGPDPPTIAALDAFRAYTVEAGARLRVLAQPVSLGGSEARNRGVREARGAWVAFLDDDDLWLPHKLSVQLDIAAQSSVESPVIASAVLARGPRFEVVWPRRLYRTGEPMAEYLFCREGWTYGAALLQTSTLLASRALLLRVPFAAGLKKHLGSKSGNPLSRLSFFTSKAKGVVSAGPQTGGFRSPGRQRGGAFLPRVLSRPLLPPSVPRKRPAPARHGAIDWGSLRRCCEAPRPPGCACFVSLFCWCRRVFGELCATPCAYRGPPLSPPRISPATSPVCTTAVNRSQA